MNDEPDLVVSAKFAATRLAVESAGLSLQSVKADLRQQVEAQLPEGYGQEHGDYAEYRERFDPSTGLFTIVYEVHL